MMEFLKTVAYKLTSRKLWAMVAGVATSIYTITGGDVSDVVTFSGLALTAFSTITYIVVEGKIDAASAGSLGEAWDNLADFFEEVFGEDVAVEVVEEDDYIEIEEDETPYDPSREV